MYLTLFRLGEGHPVVGTQEKHRTHLKLCTASNTTCIREFATVCLPLVDIFFFNIPFLFENAFILQGEIPFLRSLK